MNRIIECQNPDPLALSTANRRPITRALVGIDMQTDVLRPRPRVTSDQEGWELLKIAERPCRPRADSSPASWPRCGAGFTIIHTRRRPPAGSGRTCPATTALAAARRAVNRRCWGWNSADDGPPLGRIPLSLRGRTGGKSSSELAAASACPARLSSDKPGPKERGSFCAIEIL